MKNASNNQKIAVLLLALVGIGSGACSLIFLLSPFFGIKYSTGQIVPVADGFFAALVCLMPGGLAYAAIVMIQRMWLK